MICFGNRTHSAKLPNPCYRKELVRIEPKQSLLGGRELIRQGWKSERGWLLCEDGQASWRYYVEPRTLHRPRPHTHLANRENEKRRKSPVFPRKRSDPPAPHRTRWLSQV